MSGQTKKAVATERRDAAELYLFNDEQLPRRPDIVEAVKQGRHVCTGIRLLEKDKLCLRMVELLMLGYGLKRIARALHVSKCSVKAARDALVARGEVNPYKQRVVALFEEIVEVGSESYLAALENGEVATATIPVGMGIFYDKRAMARCEPTAIGLEARLPADPASITVERLRAWVMKLPGAVDFQSTGNCQRPAQNGA